ncbi:GNAT family N-acetyltransferase [Rhodococcus aerolatus]
MEHSSVLTLPAGTSAVLRRATPADLPDLVAMLVDDPVSAVREDADDLPAYACALAEIELDPHQLLVVAEADGVLAGTLQLTVIPGLARRGARRAQLESVHVARSHRRRGLGAAMLGWAVEEARGRGCGLVQLTSDRAREDAHRFYEGLGFTDSHVGYKLVL